VSIKTYLVGGLAVVAVAAVVGFYKTEMARARAQGRVEVLSAQTERLVADYQSFRELTAERDSVRTRELARLAEQADSLDSELTDARRQAQASADELDSLLAQSEIPDSILRPVRETMAALQRENEVCSLALKNCRTTLTVYMERASDQGQQLIKADSLILAQRELVSNLQNLPSRKWWLPRPAVGVWGGVCVDGKPCAGVGVGLAWTF